MSDEIEARRLTLERPTVTPLRYVTITLASIYTGYSARAIEAKIARDDWREGREYRRAPDGRILIDLQGYQRWIVGR